MRAIELTLVLVALVGLSCSASGSGPVLSTDAETRGPEMDAVDVGAEVCSPNCDGIECGSNGCGGQCGSCTPLLEQCSEAGLCQPYYCKSSKDCPGDLVCAQDLGECVVCIGDEDCPEQEVCGADHACHKEIPCTSDKDCKEFGLVCDKATGKCVQCLSAADCPEEKFCFDTYCLDDVCVAGQSRCEGMDVFTCNEDGSGEGLSETCGEGRYCEEGACHDFVCVPDDIWCEGNALKTCSPDGKSVATEVDCEESGDVCIDDKCATCTCMPGQTACYDDSTVLECAEDCLSTFETSCDAGESCHNGACVDWLCEPGTVFCDGEVYKVCSSNGLNTQYQEDCAEKQQHCFNGACIDTECPPSEDFCEDDATKAHCAEDGMSFTTEACPADHYCDDGDAGVQCLPWVCTPGAAFCEDNVAKVCNGKGNATANEVDCGEQVCVGGGCKPVICDAGTSSCNGNAVMECDPTGTVVGLVETCGEGQYCGENGNAAACADQVCTPNAKLCQASVVMQCDDVGAALEPVKDCKDEEKGCLDGECVEQVCGNGKPDPGEQCDDGNEILCDGCEGCTSLSNLGFSSGESYAQSESMASVFAANGTAEAWVKMPANLAAIAKDAAFLSQHEGQTSGQGFTLYVTPMDGGWKIRGQFKSDMGGCFGNCADLTATKTVVAGRWYHVAAIRQGNTVALYVDGSLQQSTTVPPGFAPQTTFVRMGQGADDWWKHYPGAIDEVRLSTVARYEGIFVPHRHFSPDAFTLALWHFDEGQGPTAGDSSMNGYDLTLLQGASWQPDDCYGTSPDAAVCGDGQQAVWEGCDDGNTVDGDGCNSGCELEVAGSSCKAILAASPGAQDGVYAIDPDGVGVGEYPFLAYCDMTTDGGGWTMCYTAEYDMVHLKTQIAYDPATPYGKPGYRSDCRNIPFREVLYANHKTEERAWFVRNAPQSTTLAATGYNASGDKLGLWTAHGVATNTYQHQMIVCDETWMWVGLMMSGYNGCWKHCNNWCNDQQSIYFRTDGDDHTGPALPPYSDGVAFNEPGHLTVEYKPMSVGLR